MSLNINNARDSVMAGQTRFVRWKRQFEEKFNEPDVENAKKGVWMNLPAEMKDKLEEQDPSLVKRMNDKYGG